MDNLWTLTPLDSKQGRRFWADCANCGTAAVQVHICRMAVIATGRGSRQQFTGRFASCPSCNQEVPARLTIDVLKAGAQRHECGSRCMGATGTNCECQCEGKNHGAS